MCRKAANMAIGVSSSPKRKHSESRRSGFLKIKFLKLRDFQKDNIDVTIVEQGG